VTYTDTQRRVVGAYASRAELVAAIVVACSLPFFCAPPSCLLSRWDGLVPLVRESDAVVWGALPPAYATVALNAPFVWWANPLGLAIPREAIERAVCDGFAPDRVRPLSALGLGPDVVRAAAEAALARVAPLSP
jgi:hypothetical protein